MLDEETVEQFKTGLRGEFIQPSDPTRPQSTTTTAKPTAPTAIGDKASRRAIVCFFDD